MFFTSHKFSFLGYTITGGDEMQRRKDTDRYGDGDVPEVDYEPYEDNHFEPHPQTRGDNRSSQNQPSNQRSGE